MPNLGVLDEAPGPADVAVQRNRRQPKTIAPVPVRKLADIQPNRDYQPKELTEDDISSRKPEEVWQERPPSPREFENVLFAWEASNFYHYPLYFEDPVLERYGHTYHEAVQPFVSAARFGVQLVGLPYQMTIDPIHKRMYPLGWYRPGEYAPKLLYQVPFNAKAAAVEAGVLTGLFFLFP